MLTTIPPTSGQCLNGLKAHGLVFSKKKKKVFLKIESANKAEIKILSARDTRRPGP